MPRVSPIHYIAPSSISVTPNANQSANDLAVYVARGAKIKVYSPRAGINMVDNTYQEWTLTGRNRRLAESEKPYTIYARLQKNDKSKGYLVFAPKNGNAQDGWTDKYNYVTTEGWTKIAGASPAGNNYYIRLGEVSLPENNERTVDLDTGILDTDDFNNNWAASPDALPLRVELGCTINDEDAGPTPYVYWGQSLVLTASLVEGWTGTDIERFDHWEITRDTQDTAADDLWNHPTGAGSYRGMTNGSITLSHARGADDDFNGSVSAVFTVTAMERIEDGNDPGNPTYEPLVSETINIHAETLEKYELVLSSRIVSFNPTSETYNPAGGVAVRVRATDQSGYVFKLTNGLLEDSGITVQYAVADTDVWTDLEFEEGASTDLAVATISTDVFAAQKNVNVRILGAGGEDSSDEESDGEEIGNEETNGEDTSDEGVSREVLDSDSISYLRDGEDSKEREWIFLRSINPITFVDQSGPNQKPALIAYGEVNPSGAARHVSNEKNQDGWVPENWWDEPQGVDEDHPYEYSAYRDFVRSASANVDDEEEGQTGGQWGNFTDPKIWSRYGGDAVTYDIVPSVSIINADAAGNVSSDGIIIQAFRIKGSERSGNILPPTTGSAYYVEYSIDGGTWTQCAMFSYQPEGEVAVQRYGIAPLSVKQAQTDIALRLKNSANPNEVLKENPPIKVVNIVSEEETQAIVEEVGDARFFRKDQADTDPYLATFGDVHVEAGLSKGSGAVSSGSLQVDGDASVAGDTDLNGDVTIGASASNEAIVNAVMQVLAQMKSQNYVDDSPIGKGGWNLLSADDNGNSYFVIDKLFVRLKAIFNELEIRKISYAGGNIIFSHAGSEIVGVKPLYRNGAVYAYRCYCKKDDGTTATENWWHIDDQAKCQTFNIQEGVHQNVENTYYWRKVIAVGSEIVSLDGTTSEELYNYADLSLGDCDANSDIPKAGDSIIQMGNRTDAERQGFISLEVFGSDAPAIKVYNYVNGYTLEDKMPIIISPKNTSMRLQYYEIETDYGVFPSAKERGEWDSIPNHRCYYFDRVQHNGSSWLCTYPQGSTPKYTTEEPSVNATYWKVDAQAGESAPSYTEEWYAWSNVQSVVNATTEPIPNGGWYQVIGGQGEYAYLWKKLIRYTWNSATRVYVAGTSQYFRMSGTNGTSISVKGSVATVADLPSTHADGDAYVVEADRHLYMWSSESNQWLDIGEFKGEDGRTYYTHVAWATSVTTNQSTGEVTNVTGFTIAKTADDTTHLWMGVYVDENSAADPDDALLYTWSYTKGVAGNNGYNTATLFLYKRSATAISSIDWSNTLTYTFANKTLSPIPTGWSLNTIPSGTAPIYVTAATAYSNTATDSIEPNEWAAPVKYVENGAQGEHGLNTASVFLYQRAASAPTKPSSALTYAFETGLLSGTLGDWSQNIPATDGNPCWVIQATAIGTGTTESIAANEWSEQRKMVEDGASISKSSEANTYKVSDSGTTTPTGTWYNTKAAANTAYAWSANRYMWTKTVIKWSDNSTTTLYSAERNPDDGLPGMSIVIDSQSVTYSKQTSGNLDPETLTYGSYPSSLSKGDWLYSKTTVVYKKSDETSAGSTNSYSVSYIGTDGNPGRAITGITEHYKASANATGETTPTSTDWGTTPTPSDWGASKPYLWNYEKITYSSGTTVQRTTASVVAIWTKDGAGIDSITNYYLATSASSGVTPSTSGWTTTVQAMTETDCYLWNYEVITYTQGKSSTSTTPHIIGHYGRDGEVITKDNETYRYATNNTGTRPDASSSSWKTTKPTLQKGYWLYTETTIHWSNDTETVLYTSERNPNDGAAGQSIIVDGSTVMKYYVGSSSTTHPAEDSSDWKDLSQVTQTQGMWLWSKSTTYYRKANSTSGSHDAGSSVQYNVSYIAEDGDTPEAARGVESVTEYYKATNSSSPMSKPTSDSGWDTDPNLSNLTNKWSETYKYLWNYEKVTYNKAPLVERTIPQILAIWTKDGNAGKGIDSITNYYLINNSSTAPSRPSTDGTGGWSTTPTPPNSSNPYLWNYEKIVWLNPSSTTYTDVQMIGHYGKDGASSLVVDIDNDSDQFGTDSNGLTLSAQNKATGVKLYYGTTLQTITKLVATVYRASATSTSVGSATATTSGTEVSGNVTISSTKVATIKSLFSGTSGTITFEIVNNVTINDDFIIKIEAFRSSSESRTANFTLKQVKSGAAGVAPDLCNLRPTLAKVSFTKSELSGSTAKKLGCGYTLVTPSGTTNAVTAASVSVNGTTYYIWWRYVGGTYAKFTTSSAIYSTGILPNTTNTGVEFVLSSASAASSIAAANTLDYENVPIIKDGTDGKGITSANVWYALNQSSTTAPSDFTLDNFPSTLNSGYYVWEATKVTYTDGSSGFTGKMCLGATTEFLTGTEVYAASASNSTTPTSWSTTYTKTKGYYLWTATRVQYTNGTYAYLNPKCVGYWGTDGTSSYVADIDNEMDAVQTDDKGYAVKAQSVTTTAKLYYGNTARTFKTAVSGYTSGTPKNGVTVEWNNITTAASSDTITFAFATTAKFTTGKMDFDITLTDGTDTSVTRTVHFTVNGINGDVYNIVPSVSEIVATRDASGNYLVNGSFTYTMGCKYTKDVDGVRSTYDVAADGTVDGKYYVFRALRRRSDQKWQTWNNGIVYDETKPRFYERFKGTVPNININEYDAMEILLCANGSSQTTGWAPSDETEMNIIDRELVYVVANGEDGLDGISSVFESSHTTQWALSSSGTTQPTSWSDTRGVPNQSTRYLWQKDVYEYTAPEYGMNLMRCTDDLSLKGNYTTSWSQGGVCISGSGGTVTRDTTQSLPFGGLFSCIKISNTNTTQIGFAQGTRFLHTGKITMSCWVKGDVDAVFHLQVAWNQTGASGQQTAGSSGNYTATTDWKKYTYTGNINVESSDWCMGYVYLHTNGKTIYVAGLKVEYGDVATDWNKAPEDYNHTDIQVVEVCGLDGTSPCFADIDNEMDSVACGTDGKPTQSTTLETTVSMWHGTTLQNITSVKVNGTAINTTAKTIGIFSVKYVVVDTKKRKIQVTVGTSSVLPLTNSLAIEISDGTETRNLSFVINGVRPGAKGDAATIYSLVPSTSSIKKDKNNTLTPASPMTCDVRKIVGNTTPTRATSSDGTLRYRVDGDITVSTDGTALTINTGTVAYASSNSYIVFAFFVGTTMVDKERVPIIYDGNDGTSPILVTLDNVHQDFLYNDLGTNLTGTVTSQAHFYDGVTEKTPDSWAVSCDGGSTWKSGTNYTSGNAKAKISSAGLLTVEQLYVQKVKLIVRASYKTLPYYAEFTANKVSHDTYELVPSVFSVPYNSATYSTVTVTFTAKKMDITGTPSAATISYTSGSGNVRLFYKKVNASTFTQLTNSSGLSISASDAASTSGYMLELRVYDDFDDLLYVGDYQTISIVKAENGADAPNLGENLINYTGQPLVITSNTTSNYNTTSRWYSTPFTVDGLNIPDNTPLSGQMRIKIEGCSNLNSSRKLFVYLSQKTSGGYPKIATALPTANGTYEVKRENFTVNSSGNGWANNIYFAWDRTNQTDVTFGTNAKITIDRVKLEIGSKCTAWCLSEQDKRGPGVALALIRNMYTEANWNSWCTLGTNESWTFRTGDPDFLTCRVGDYFTISGTATDSGLKHISTHRCTSVSSSIIYGTVTEHITDGENGITIEFDSPILLFTQQIDENSTTRYKEASLSANVVVRKGGTPVTSGVSLAKGTQGDDWHFNGSSITISGTTVTLASAGIQTYPSGGKNYPYESGYVIIKVTYDGKTYDLPLKFLLNALGTIDRQVRGDVETTIAQKTTYTVNGTSYTVQDDLGTFVRSSTENISTLTSTTDDTVTAMSQVLQKVDNISLTVYDNDEGIDLFTHTSDVSVGTQFTSVPTTSNTTACKTMCVSIPMEIEKKAANSQLSFKIETKNTSGGSTIERVVQSCSFNNGVLTSTLNKNRFDAITSYIKSSKEYVFGVLYFEKTTTSEFKMVEVAAKITGTTISCNLLKARKFLVGSSLKDGLVATGIDIKNKLISLKANTVEFLNNSNLRTAWLDDIGNFTINGVYNNLITTINADNVGNYIIKQGSEYYLDVLKCGDNIVIDKLPDGFSGTLNLPFYANDVIKKRGYTRYLDSSTSTPRLMTTDEMRMLVGRKIVVRWGDNVVGSSSDSLGYVFFPDVYYGYGGATTANIETRLRSVMCGQKHFQSLGGSWSIAGGYVRNYSFNAPRTVFISFELVKFHSDTSGNYSYGYIWMGDDDSSRASKEVINW